MSISASTLRRGLLSAAAFLVLATSTKGATPAPARHLAHTGQIIVQVVPDHPDWTYQLGESATFTVRVTRDGHPIPNLRLRYRIGLENMPPDHAGEADLPPEGLALEIGPVATPGFWACEVEVDHDGETHRGRAAAGFAPDAIQPTVANPEDFEAFWAAGKTQLAAIDIDAQITALPDSNAGGVECSQVSLANVPSSPTSRSGAVSPASRLFGVLCEPNGQGPFPAVLAVPGAGVRAYHGARALAARGVITFQMGIHGIPINLPDHVYEALGKGALANYPLIHNDDRERHYYRRVYLGAVRGNDFLTTRPRWDRHNLGVLGGSQGGALAIVTAALDPRVRALVAYYPALADHTGFLHGRTGGWPFMFRPESARSEDRITTMAYFDVVNFARRVKVPGFYTWGYNDTTCPPTSMFAAYNTIPGPRTLLLAVTTGHATLAEQSKPAEAWLLQQLGVGIAKKNGTRTTPATGRPTNQ